MGGRRPTKVLEEDVRRAVEYGLQPALLAGALAIWFPFRGRPELYLLVLVAAQVVLGILEHFVPARTDWIQAPREKIANVALVLAFTTFAAGAGALYQIALAQPLRELRANLGLDLWPAGWPLAARVLLAFLASELVWY